MHRVPAALALLATFGLVLALPVLAWGADDDASMEDGNRISISLGSQRTKVNGNVLRFRQYVTPPNGTYSPSIRVMHPLDEHGRAFGATITDLFEPSAGGAGYLYDADLGLSIDTRQRNSNFYRTFYAGASELRRKDWQTDVRWRATSRDTIAASYSVVDMDGLTGDADQNFTDERYNLTYARRLSDYNVAGSLSIQQFGFPVGAPYFDGDTSTYSLTVEPASDGRTLLAGRFVSSSTDLEGSRVSPDQTSVALSGFRQITNDLSVAGDLQYWELDDSIANNAYAKKELLAGIEGEYTGLWRSTLRAGFETAEVDYVNGRQTAVVEPSVNTTTLGLRSRPRRDVKVQADWRTRRVDDRPAAFDTGGNPVTTRIWSESEMLRIRATWTPSFWPAGLTAGYRAEERENPNQGTSNEIVTKDITGWWAVRDDVNVTASYMNQDFDLNGILLSTPFVSESETWTVGANWQISDQTTLDASYARADSFGGISLKQKTFSVNVDHEWDTHNVRLGVTLDDLDDFNGTLLGYDADMWYAEFSTLLP